MNPAFALSLFLILFPLGLRAQFHWYPTGGPTGGVVSSLVLNGQGHIFASTLNRGVFSSIDGGTTWMSMNTNLPVHEIRTLVISDGNLYAGAGTGHVFKFSYGAKTWSLLAYLPSEIHTLSVDARGRIFAGSGGEGVIRVEMDEERWEQTGLKHVSVQCLASGPSGEMYAGTNLGLFLSADGGYTWKRIELPGIYVFSLAVDREGTVFAGTWTGKLYRSRSQGKGWTEINLGPKNSVIRNLTIDKKQHVFAAATGGGVFRSIDGGIQWETMNDGLTDLSVRSFVVDDHGVAYAGTSSGIVFRTSGPEESPAPSRSSSGPSHFLGIR